MEYCLRGRPDSQINEASDVSHQMLIDGCSIHESIYGAFSVSGGTPPLPLNVRGA